MSAATRLALLYSLFAAIATVVNIGVQMLCIALYSGAYAVEISILVGTACGLPVKYVLEKRYIFVFRTDNLAHDGRLFVVYTIMGVFTTLLFWGVEYAFHLIFATDLMRYVGGVTGLCIGYAVKYQLDKRYVFVKGADAIAAAGNARQ